MLNVAYRIAVALAVTILALALMLGFQTIAEVWLGIVIFLEAYVGSAFAGLIGLMLVTPVTFILLYGFKDPRKS